MQDACAVLIIWTINHSVQYFTRTYIQQNNNKRIFRYFLGAMFYVHVPSGLKSLGTDDSLNEFF